VGSSPASQVQVVQIMVADVHTCILTSIPSVMCWGSNDYGQLGYGHKLQIGDDDMPFTAGYVNTGTVPIAQLTGGYAHSCAVTVNGSVMCWGYNSNGQLGYGHINNIGDNELPVSAGYVRLPGGISVTQVVAGAFHSCALSSNGSVACWGSNGYGELGLGHTNKIGDNELPSTSGFAVLGVPVTLLGSGCMAQHVCALALNGSAICWGFNTFGNLGYGHVNNIGDNEYPSSAGFVNAGALAVFVDIHCGQGVTCGLYSNGSVK
jgi:alpha-tubulin suppressor-like RCC1 family protein